MVINSDSVFESQTRHQNGDTHFLTLDEILDETKLLDITLKQKQWLMNEVEICIYTTNIIFTKGKLFFPQNDLCMFVVAMMSATALIFLKMYNI